MAKSASSAVQSGSSASPDVSIYWKAIFSMNKIYATNPLAVDHEKGVFSNTWNGVRGDEDWMGNKMALDEVVEKWKKEGNEEDLWWLLGGGVLCGLGVAGGVCSWRKRKRKKDSE